MKKTLCLIAAALMLIAAGCSKKPSGGTAAPTVGASQNPSITQDQGADPSQSGATYDRSKAVVFENGEVSGTFNWDYFTAKAAAGIAGSVDIVRVDADGEKHWVLEFTGAGFKLTGEGIEAQFARMMTDTVGSGEETKVISILTSSQTLTVDEFAEGFDRLPDICEVTEQGAVVYFGDVRE